MTKTPEEYFQEQEFRSEPEAREDTFTEAEKAFLEKYLGLEEPDILEKLGIEAPVEAKTVPVPEPEPEPEPEISEEPEAPEEVVEDVAEEVAEEEAEEVSEAAGEVEAPETEAEALPQRESLEPDLQRRDSLQLVSFMVRHQEYTLPIEAVQEVVRAVKPTQVPEAPSYMAGLVNLRGRVTPLVRLDVLLGLEHGRKRLGEVRDGEEAVDDGQDRFIVVCRKKGLQVGLQVRQVTTMYRISQDRIEWNIESRLGGTQEQLVTALMRKDDDTLVGILSIDKIVERILKR